MHEDIYLSYTYAGLKNSKLRKEENIRIINNEITTILKMGGHAVA
jgi:hypothetical protein